jgi:hypothetical protein
MKSKLWQRSLGALAVAAVVPASAAVITFEELAPTLLGVGESAMSGGMTLTQTNLGFGFVDTAAAFGPQTGLDVAIPQGTMGQFYTSTNDGSVKLTSSTGAAFNIRSFDFGFAAPLTALFGPNEVAGALVVDYVTESGIAGLEIFGAASDGAGLFNMATASAAAFQSNRLTSLTFTFVSPDGSGFLVNPNLNFNQFALDNIQIPEPTSVALAVLALGLMGGMNARRAKTPSVRSSN